MGDRHNMGCLNFGSPASIYETNASHRASIVIGFTNMCSERSVTKWPTDYGLDKRPFKRSLLFGKAMGFLRC